MSGRWFWLGSAVCVMMYQCGSGSRFAPTKPDPTKGTVTGTVICADTGKPARFATVQLLPSPNGLAGEGAPSEQQAVTDLDGKFKIEAVTPGDYFAVATLDGYLDPVYGIDFDRMNAKGGDNEQTADVIEQWKEHMVEVSVSAHNPTDFTIQIERGAEVTGTVAYDDGSPAIGMRFALYRKNAKGGLSTVGPKSDQGFSLEEKSDARGRFAVTNLPAGEYTVCTLLPGDSQASSPQVCLGNVFRKRDARTITASPGDTVNGADIVIPLHSIHSVTGSIVQGVKNQSPTKATVHLLYADDREPAMAVDMFSDGSFLFPFVPEGAYIVQVTNATYEEPAPQAGADSSAKTAAKAHAFADREVAVTVQGDVTDLSIALVEAPAQKPPPAGH